MAGRIQVINDANDGASCSVAGGSTVIACLDTGSLWIPTGNGVAASASIPTLEQVFDTSEVTGVVSVDMAGRQFQLRNSDATTEGLAICRTDCATNYLLQYFSPSSGAVTTQVPDANIVWTIPSGLNFILERSAGADQFTVAETSGNMVFSPSGTLVQSPTGNRTYTMGDNTTDTIEDNAGVDYVTVSEAAGNRTGINYVLCKDTTNTTVSNTATQATILSTTCTIPGGLLGTNGCVEILLIAEVLTNDLGDDPLDIVMEYGAGSVTATKTPTASASTRTLSFHGSVCGDGATNAQYLSTEGQLGANLQQFNGQNTSAIDSTVAQTLDIEVDWDIASTSLSITRFYSQVMVLP